MNPHLLALAIEFLSQYPIDSDENFSVLMEDGTVIDKVGDTIWVSKITIKDEVHDNEQSDSSFWNDID